MKHILSTIKQRWSAKIPIFFRWVMGISSSVAAIALAINVALNSSGAVTPAWWQLVYPYLIGIGAGMTACAKLTQEH